MEFQGKISTCFEQSVNLIEKSCKWDGGPFHVAHTAYIRCTPRNIFIGESKFSTITNSIVMLRKSNAATYFCQALSLSFHRNTRSKISWKNNWFVSDIYQDCCSCSPILILCLISSLRAHCYRCSHIIKIDDFRRLFQLLSRVDPSHRIVTLRLTANRNQRRFQPPPPPVKAKNPLTLTSDNWKWGLIWDRWIGTF